MPVQIAVLGPGPDTATEPFELTSVGPPTHRTRAVFSSLRRPYLAARVDVRRFSSVLASQPWTSIQAELEALVPMRVPPHAPVVLNAHNVETDLVESFRRIERNPILRARWAWEVSKTRRHESSVLAAVDAVCATSDADAAALERLGGHRIVLVPNGVSIEEVPYAFPTLSHEIAYVGHFGFRPNVAAALELVHGVLPFLRKRVHDATAVLIGRDPPPALLRLRGPLVDVTGELPDAVSRLRLAGATVIPLRAGSGSRLKVLEAMAAGVPVVSTPYGVTGIAAQPGRDVLVASTTEGLAEAAAVVMTDPHRAGALSAAGRQLVVEHYDWSVLARPLVSLHAELGSPR